MKLIGMRRAAALALLACALWGGACTRGPEAARLVIDVRTDGSVWLNGQEGCAGVAPDEEALASRLAVIAQTFPRLPMDPRNPRSLTVPEGCVELRVDAAAPFGVLRRVTDACLRSGIQLWEFRLVPVSEPSGVTMPAIPFRLPKDAGVNACNFELKTQPFVVVPTGVPPDQPLTFLLRSPIANPDPRPDATDLAFEDERVAGLADLRARLIALRTSWPERSVLLEVPDDHPFARVVEMMDALAGIGLGSCKFAGGWVEWGEH